MWFLISFKEAPERNGKHADWVGEKRFHGREGSGEKCRSG